MCRAIEIYHSFDIAVSAPLLKAAYIQKAQMHVQQSDLDHARHCYELIMRLFMEVKFENYEEIAVARTEYGRLLVMAGEPAEAALLFQQSIDVYRRRAGDNWVCVEVAENLLERGAALLDLKVHDEAQPCLEDCLKMLPMVLGEDKAQRDPRMAACHNHLAAVFHFFEEFPQALQHYQAAQQVYMRAKMEFSLEHANVCNNLATLYDDMVRTSIPLQASLPTCSEREYG
jgi:tetratricopeptide (TPR) repeat protein